MNNLPIDITVKIQECVTNPPNSVKYENIKSEVLNLLSRSSSTCIKELENLRLDGRTPSQLWRHMKKLNQEANSPYTTVLLRRRFTKLLPAAVQMHLSVAEDDPIENYTKKADNLIENYIQEALTISQIDPLPSAPTTLPRQEAQMAAVSEKTSQTQRMEDISDRLVRLEDAILNLGRGPPAPAQAPANSYTYRQEPIYPRGRRQYQDRPASQYCFYHDRFGHNAFKCEQPCAWPDQQEYGQYHEGRGHYAPSGNQRDHQRYPENRNHYTPSGNDMRGGRFH